MADESLDPETLESVLRGAQEQLEIVSNANQVMLETLSHGLRTPLNSIIGFADMIEQEMLGPISVPQYRAYAEDIQKSGRSMLDLMNDLLDRKRFEKFEKSEKDFRHIIDLAPDLICICRDGKITMINPAGANMLGLWPVDTVVGRNFSNFVHPEYFELFESGPQSLIAEKLRVPVRFQRADGVEVDAEIAALPYQEEDLDDGSGSSVMLMARDVTERNRTLRNLAAREEHIRKIMDTVVDGIITIDQMGMIETLNPAIEEIFGYSLDEMVGQNVNMLMSEPEVSEHDEYLARYRETGETSVIGNSREVVGCRKDGSSVSLELAVSVLDMGTRKTFIGALRDITERKEHERRLRVLATTDPLTGMPNRMLFSERLGESIRLADTQQTKIAVIFVDLDHFKTINDAIGHVAGDEVIKIAGRRLTESVRQQDTVAHLGGDEFHVVLNGVANQREVAFVAQKMLSALSRPYHVDDREIFSSASIGVALYPGSAETKADLLRNVDTATHHAKDKGRDNYQFYTSDLSAEVRRRHELANSLRRALENDEFELHYQAKVALDNRQITGAEALIRWNSPTLGNVSPVEFIPVAEETGQIVDIGQWVIETACREAAGWKSLTPDPVQVSVNLSAMQFVHGDLTSKVVETLKETGLNPTLLDLELTESMMVSNPEQTIRILQTLKEMGASVSIDDFGTGYSSLSYLTRFPLDSLKVDRAFVTNLPDDPDAVAIAKAIVSMAQNLNLHIVAEGIETEDHFSFLHKLGCDTGQGYLFSKPVPKDEFCALLSVDSENAFGNDQPTVAAAS